MAVVFLGVPGRSQTTESFTSIQGELHSEAPVYFRDYWVELGDLDHHHAYRADVQSDGSFQLHDVPAGSYILRVTTHLVQQEWVNVTPHAGSLVVHLRAAAAKPFAPGTVSLNQLRHPPSRKAIEAAVSAQRFSASGKTEKAVEKLEKAIRISPEYADAYNNLAVQHIRLGRYEEACDDLSRANAIGGPNAVQLGNLAYAQYRLNRFPEAIASARAALRVDAGYAQAHFILWSMLAGDPGTRAEALRHLERAARTLHSAREMLERLHSDR
jgi:tetratricopeptide (TPR) repeat protein